MDLMHRFTKLITMRLFVISILFLFSSLIVSSSVLCWETPDEALSQYLAFELAGGRLSSWNFNKYLAVSKDYDEPGWDRITLVKSYKVTPMSCKHNVCSSVVTFVLAPTVGISDPQVVSNPKGGVERITFVAIHGTNGWLLKPNAGFPHILEVTYKNMR